MPLFKASKFRNAATKTPKREELILSISARSIQSSYGNHIKASSSFMAFNVDSSNGGNIAVLPVNDVGRKDSYMPLLYAHSSLTTDFDFSPFEPSLLATCGQEGSVKFWSIPEEGLKENLSSARSSFSTDGERVDCVLFHPTAGGLLSAALQKTVKIYDVTQEKELTGLNVSNDSIQSLSWRLDGTILASSSKDKKVRLVDVRQGSVSSEAAGHQSIKDSRVCWLGDKDYLVTTGFDQSRRRQMMVWDVRNFTNCIESHNFGTSTGILIPLFDPDTNMLFFSGKGDTSVRFWELKEASPFLREATTYMSQNQTKGIALVPKHALDVMACEVNRVLQLTQDSVVPLKYDVPRKSYSDFQSDLFPDTRGFEPAVTAQEWFDGKDGVVSKVSLNPSKHSSVCNASSDRGQQSITKAEGSGDQPQKSNLPQKSTQSLVSQSTSQSVSQTPSTQSSQPELKTALPSFQKSEPTGEQSATAEPRKVVPKKFTRFSSKFRHIHATLMHRTTFITNLRSTSISTTMESDGFHVNTKWAAVPLKGPGGNISILDMSQRIKLPETGVPYIQHGCGISDFVWDPFNENRLAVSTENAKIAIWDIQKVEGGDPVTELQTELMGHNDKIYLIRFHPLAKDIILSASQDLTVKVWNIESQQEVITLEGHTDQIYSAAWSQDGSLIATYSKDAKIRIYEPRVSVSPIKEGKLASATRGGRLLWVLKDTHLVLSRFKRASERTLSLYKLDDLDSPLLEAPVDTNPAVMIPYYDEDTNVIVCSGKGDNSATLFEVLPSSPYLAILSPFKCGSPHQAFSFLPKTVCNVKDVEVMRCLRLTMTTIEPITFTVPRVKTEYFQDDIFPETKVKWEPTMSSSEWLDGQNGPSQKTLSLCPPGMKLLSEAPKAAPVTRKYESKQILEEKSDEQKKEEILNAMTNKLTLKEEPLPQDEMQGADDDEWDD